MATFHASIIILPPHKLSKRQVTILHNLQVVWGLPLRPQTHQVFNSFRFVFTSIFYFRFSSITWFHRLHLQLNRLIPSIRKSSVKGGRFIRLVLTCYRKILLFLSHLSLFLFQLLQASFLCLLLIFLTFVSKILLLSKTLKQKSVTTKMKTWGL